MRVKEIYSRSKNKTVARLIKNNNFTHTPIFNRTIYIKTNLHHRSVSHILQKAKTEIEHLFQVRTYDIKLNFMALIAISPSSQITVTILMEPIPLHPLLQKSVINIFTSYINLCGLRVLKTSSSTLTQSDFEQVKKEHNLLKQNNHSLYFHTP
jgi:hypothetical protein